MSPRHAAMRKVSLDMIRPAAALLFASPSVTQRLSNVSCLRLTPWEAVTQLSTS